MHSGCIPDYFRHRNVGIGARGQPPAYVPTGTSLCIQYGVPTVRYILRINWVMEDEAVAINSLYLFLGFISDPLFYLYPITFIFLLDFSVFPLILVQR